MQGIAQHCSAYQTIILEDCGQRDRTADILTARRRSKPRPDLMAVEYEVPDAPVANDYYHNARVFMGSCNLGVAGNSNRALKLFMDGDCDHLCLCNDDLLVTGDFVKFYAQAHQDLGVEMFCFCVGGNTPLITRTGITTISEAVGTEIEIWNGMAWSKVTPVLTRKQVELYRVRLSDGSYVDCTEDHGFSVKNRYEANYRKVAASSLLNEKYAVQCEPTVIKRDGSGETVREADAYTLGFAVGEGHWAKVKNPKGSAYDYCHVYLYGAKKMCPVAGLRYPEKDRIRVVVNIDPEKIQKFKDHASALNALFGWNERGVLAFIAGLADADGSNTSSGGIRITVAEEARALRLQLLLTAVGIRSSVGLDRRAGTQTNLGTLTRDLYHVQVTDCGRIPCRRLNTSRGHVPKFKSKFQTVRSVEKLPGLHDVFCFTEPNTHKGLFANVLTYQCDFTEASPAISGAPESYKWTTYRVRGYGVKFLPRFTGIMMSVTRKLVEKIGYFDAEFGKFGEEHCDYTIRARFAGGIRCEGQDMNCLDVEHALLKHQDVATSMTGALRKHADAEARQIMQRASFEYRFRHYYRPFRLVYPVMANGYYGAGLPCRQLEQIGYKLVTALV